MRRKLAGIGLALAFGTLPFAADAAELTLWHSWSNESEMAALNTIVNAFDRQGQHGRRGLDAARDRRREPAGQPVRRRHAAEPLHRRRFRASSATSKRRARRRTWTRSSTRSARPRPSPRRCSTPSPSTARSCKIPVAVHIDGMVYYNKKVAEAAGVDPTKWTSLDDMWADQKKVNDAGYTFIAIGGNTFQAGYTFHPLLAADRRAGHLQPLLRRHAGQDRVRRARAASRRSRRSARSSAQTDEGWVNRAWNDTTNTVINGTALMQIHGDWMKGVWRANKQEGRRRLRLHQHPRHQGAVGDGRFLRHPWRRRRRDAQGRGGVRLDRRRSEDQRRVRLLSRDRARCASTCRPTSSTPATSWCSIRSKKPDFSVQNPFYIGDSTGSIRSGTRCSPTRAIPT